MHSLLSGAHSPPFRHPHVAHPSPVIAPRHVGVGALYVQLYAHVLHGPLYTLPLMHVDDAAHHPQPSAFAQCSAFPIAAHLGSHGISISFVTAFTTRGAFITGGKCDTHSAASSKE